MRDANLPVLTSAELVRAGEALYGAHWRAELARAFGLADEAPIRAVEAGRVNAPLTWRAQLIALAQDAALRAMDVAGSLLWQEAASASDASAKAAPQPAYAPRLV